MSILATTATALQVLLFFAQLERIRSPWYFGWVAIRKNRVQPTCEIRIIMNRVVTHTNEQRNIVSLLAILFATRCVKIISALYKHGEIRPLPPPTFRPITYDFATRKREKTENELRKKH